MDSDVTTEYFTGKPAENLLQFCVQLLKSLKGIIDANKIFAINS